MKRYTLTAATLVLAAAAGTVPVAGAQTGTYEPQAPTPAQTANEAGKDLRDGFAALRASRRTAVKITIDDATPGTYTVTVYRRGTTRKLITGDRTVKGTTVKPAKVSLKLNSSARSYFKSLKRADRTTYRADLRVAFTPAGGGKTTVRKRVVTIGL